MSDDIVFREPVAEDGSPVFELIKSCPPLDTNSMYCNLLQCSHFAATSVAAEINGELVGFVSGYLIPESPTSLFVWQVAVSSKARGKGLATLMIQHILQREVCAKEEYIQTTLTEDNQASWALFKRLSDKLNTSYESSVMFDKQQHFNSAHDSEMLVKIGPF